MHGDMASEESQVKRKDFVKVVKMAIFIDQIALAKQGDNVLGSIRPSICLSVCQ